MELKEELEIVDPHGLPRGQLEVEIAPCDGQGREFSQSDDVFVDNPQQLRGRNVFYRLRIGAARGLPAQYTVTKWI